MADKWIEIQGLLVCPSLCENAGFSLTELAGEGMSLMGMNKMARNEEELLGRQGWNGEPCCGHPIWPCCPCQELGKPPAPRPEEEINMKLGCWNRRGSSCMSEQYIFSKESTFSKQPSKRHDLLHTTALSTTWSVWNFPSFCASAMSSKKQTKRKKTFQILRKSV